MMGFELQTGLDPSEILRTSADVVVTWMGMNDRTAVTIKPGGGGGTERASLARLHSHTSKSISSSSQHSVHLRLCFR